MKCDIVIGLSYGDESKGKITHHLLKTNKYTHCCRFSGSQNAGHVIYHNGVKHTTHMIPAGVFSNVVSVIAPDCVFNVKKLFEEIEILEKAGIAVSNLLKIANTCNIITDDHILEENNESKIGTTRSGVGPAYRDKYAREGKLAESIPELKSFLVDFYDEIHMKNSYVLFEGAQGHYLDINFGHYPFVTSSHCGVAGVLMNGVSPRSINQVYGAAKAYETYLGLMKFEGKDPVFAQFRQVGNEVGNTTGRTRQCNFINIDELKKAIIINGVDNLVISKMDVLQKVNCWKIRYDDGLVIDLLNEEEFKNYFHNIFPNLNIIFSYSPEEL